MDVKLTQQDVRDAFKLLGVLFNAPYTSRGGPSKEELVQAWRQVLTDVDRSEFRTAVDAWVKGDSKFFPKPGQIRAQVMDHRAANGVTLSREAKPLTDGAGCTVCGRPWEPVPPAGRLGIWHDEAKHDRVGAPIVGDHHKEYPNPYHHRTGG